MFPDRFGDPDSELIDDDPFLQLVRGQAEEGLAAAPELPEEVPNAVSQPPRTALGPGSPRERGRGLGESLFPQALQRFPEGSPIRTDPPAPNAARAMIAALAEGRASDLTYEDAVNVLKHLVVEREQRAPSTTPDGRRAPWRPSREVFTPEELRAFEALTNAVGLALQSTPEFLGFDDRL
jgi:hypothetical protein